MNSLFLVTLSLLFTSSLFSQIGASIEYSDIGTLGWEDVRNWEAVEDFEGGLSYGINYSFKLKNYRVEFLPVMSYSNFRNGSDFPRTKPQNLKAELDIYAASLNTQFYIFDLKGDCDCPTWGLQGSVFKKGFFLMAGPGVSTYRHNDIVLREPAENRQVVESNTTRFTFSTGIGLDIDVAKFLTITPIISLKWHSSGSWEALDTLATFNGNQDNFEDFDSMVTQLHGGLRFSYIWAQ